MKVIFCLLDGIGGIILRNGYLNHLSKNSEKILLIVYDYHKNLIRYMFKHLENLEFFYVPFCDSPEEIELRNKHEDKHIIEIYNEYYKSIYPDYEYMNIEWYSTFFRDTHPIKPLSLKFNFYRNDEIENNFYNKIVSEYGEKYILYQNCLKEDEFNKLMSKKLIIDNKEYDYKDAIFLRSHFQEWRKNISVNPIYLNKENFRYINLHNLSENMLDACKLLEYSAEIHLVPGPYPLLIKFLIDIDNNFLKNKKIFLHRYARPNYAFIKNILECKRFTIIDKQQLKKKLKQK